MKRTISLILALFMLCGLIPFSVLTVSAAGDAVISVENVSATVNSTVDVAISISGNTGIASMGIILTFDSSLVLVGAQNGEAFSELTMTPPSQLKNGGSVTGSCRFAWLGTDNVTDDGVILNLKFRVSDDAQLNKDCVVSVVCENVFDEGRNSVTVSTVDGAVKVINYIPGDVDGNGVINMLDVLTLCQYYVDAEGYGVNINPLAGDVDANGMVNMLDVLMVCQYYVDAEGYNVTLLPGKVSCSHELQNVPAKDATCTEAGNIAYFTCTKCGKYFSDAEGKTEITAKETVIAMKGHTEVIDEAVAPTYTTTGKTEGSHCSVCNKILREQTEIPMLEAKYHSVTYRNTKDAVIPVEKMKYAEHEGLLDLPVLSVDGYVFKGWYTGSESGTKVDHIVKGSKEDYVLYAHWELVKYTITYKDAPISNNPTEFTVEDEIILNDPEWFGLAFKNWTDENGAEKCKVDKGTARNITFYANWLSERNLAVPSNSKEAKVVLFDDNTGRYYVIYDIGTIENIVLSTLGIDDKNSGETLKWNISETVSVENDIAKTIAKTVSTSISRTDGWSNTLAVAKKDGSSISSSITAGLEVEEMGLKAKIEATIGATTFEEITKSRAYGTSGSDTSIEGSSDSTSATVSYKKGTSTTIGKEITIPGEMPKGKYSYVCAGTVRVYAVITYDPAEHLYYIDTFSIMEDSVYEKRMHDAPANTTANITSSEGLSLNIEDYWADIKKHTESIYTVQYDANGGEGTMLRSVHNVGEKSTLQPNKFSRVGYTFAGWGTSPDGGVMYVDGSNVQDVAEKGAMVMLYAIWIPNSYKLTYNINDIYDLSASVNAKIYDVVFDGEYSLLVPDYKYSDYYEFAGWYTSSGEQLTDENGKSLSAWGSVKDCEIYARWNKKYEDYVYIRSREDLEAINSNPRCKYMLIDDILLFDEEWQPLNTFYGEFDGQDHIIAGMTIRKPWKECGLFARTEEAFIHNVQLENVIIENTYSKDYSHTGCIAGYAVETTIENCKVSGQIVTDPTSVVDEHLRAYANKLVGGPKNCTFLSNETHKLSVSIFLFARTSEDYTITDSGRWNQPKDILPISTAPLKMQDQSLDALKMTFWLDNKDIFRGNHWMFIYTYNDTWLAEHQFWAPDEGWGTTEFTYTLSISNIINNRIKILYGASGDMADDWMAGTLKIRVVF